jgi:hypothetical protein
VEQHQKEFKPYWRQQKPLQVGYSQAGTVRLGWELGWEQGMELGCV